MALWTPALIDTALWLDAADSSTITESGGAVSKWDDKSGNDRHVAQATPSDRPGFDAADKYLDFSGSSAHLFNAAPFLFAAGDIHVFAVMDVMATSDARWMCEGSSTNTAPVYNVSQCLDSAPVANGGSFHRDDDGTTRLRQDTDPYENMFAGGKHINYTRDLTGTRVLGRDGVLGSATTYTRGSLTVDRFCIGGLLRSTFITPMDFKLYEVVVVTGVLSDVDRQYIEGYLAHRHGTAGALQEGHPYKDAAPSIFYVSGTITDEHGDPAQRTVYAMSRPTDGSAPQVLVHTQSDPITGEYQLNLVTDDEVTRIVLAEDQGEPGPNDPVLPDLVDRVIPG